MMMVNQNSNDQRAHLKPSRISTMELFCEDSKRYDGVFL